MLYRNGARTGKNHLARPRRHEPTGAAVIGLRDGRRLVGKITSSELTLQNSFGPEKIAWSSVQSLTAGRGGMKRRSR